MVNSSEKKKNTIDAKSKTPENDSKKNNQEEQSTTKQQEKTPEQEKLELIGTIQRLQAEFENYKKRVEREQENMRLRAEEHLLKELIPLVDNFTIALKSHENKESEFFKGIEIIFAQLMQVLENHNVTKIPAQEKFDPRLHEALMSIKSEGKKPGEIVQILQEGYMIKDKVLRPAKVSISKKE